MRVLVIAGQLSVSWDVGRNRDRVTSFLQRESQPGALVVLPEAMLTGYDDTLSGLSRLDPAEVRAAADALADVVSEAGVQLLVGSLWPVSGGWANAALLLTAAGGRWIYPKVNLAATSAAGSWPGPRCRCARCPDRTGSSRPACSCAANCSTRSSGMCWPEAARGCWPT